MALSMTGSENHQKESIVIILSVYCLEDVPYQQKGFGTANLIYIFEEDSLPRKLQRKNSNVGPFLVPDFDTPSNILRVKRRNPKDHLRVLSMKPISYGLVSKISKEPRSNFSSKGSRSEIC